MVREGICESLGNELREGQKMRQLGTYEKKGTKPETSARTIGCWRYNCGTLHTPFLITICPHDRKHLKANVQKLEILFGKLEKTGRPNFSVLPYLCSLSNIISHYKWG